MIFENNYQLERRRAKERAKKKSYKKECESGESERGELWRKRKERFPFLLKIDGI